MVVLCVNIEIQSQNDTQASCEIDCARKRFHYNKIFQALLNTFVNLSLLKMPMYQNIWAPHIFEHTTLMEL